MAKIALLLISLLVLSTATVTPNTFFESNYDGFKEFIQGFLDGYEGETVELPAECLTEQAQAKLDEDLVAIFMNLLSLKPMEAAESLRDFIGDIDAVGNDCGVNIISDNFNADIEKNGLSWIITNIFWHIADIEAKALDALENLVLENWEVAGKSMGEIINYIAPPQAN